MPAPLVSWQPMLDPDGIAGTGTTPDLQLTDIKSLVDQHVAANPSTALWEVKGSDLDGSSKYVLIGRRDGSAGRVMFFGGAVPAAAAVNFTAANTVLYIGYAPASIDSAPTTDYASGAPFADWLKGAVIAALSTRWHIFESSAGIVGMLRQGDTSACHFCAGELALDADDNIFSCVAASGQSSSATWAAASLADSQYSLFSNIASTGTTRYGIGSAKLASGEARLYRLAGYRDTVHFRNSAGNRRFYAPWLLANNEAANGHPGVYRLRQISVGQRANYKDVVLDAGTSAITAYAITPHTTGAFDTLWLTQFAV